MTPAHVKTSLTALAIASTPPHLQAAPSITMSDGAAAAPIAASPGMVSTPSAAYDAAIAAAHKAGAEAERTRIGAILNHEAAAGRGKLAAHLAFKTSMSVEGAGEMLAASATEGAAMGAADAGFSWDEIVAGFNSNLPSAAAAHQGRASAGQEPAQATARADAGFSWDDVVGEFNAANGFSQGDAR